MTGIKIHSCAIIEDENGNISLPLPKDLLSEAEWKTGDVICFTDVGPGMIYMKKCEGHVDGSVSLEEQYTQIEHSIIGQHRKHMVGD